MNKPKNNRFCLLLAAVGMLLLGGCLVSCNDSDELADGDVYLRLGETVWEEDNTKKDLFVDDDYAWPNSKAGGIKAFFIYTNLPDWSVSPGREEDRAWVEIWPGEGQRDGRFYVRIHANDQAVERETKLNILSSGVVRRSFAVTQLAGDPSLVLDFTESRREIDPAGETFVVKVTANVAWQAVLSEGAEAWIRPGALTAESQEFTVLPNTDGTKRSGRIDFRAVGHSLARGFTVEQESEQQGPADRILIVK